MVRFGQVVVGAAGAGKTTYCNGVKHLLSLEGRPNLFVVNLDPASENYAYECDVDVRDLVCARTVQEEYKLGPNGSLVYCIEYLENHLEWLHTQLRGLGGKGKGEGDGSGGPGDDLYVVLDCPGQVELYSTHDSFRAILRSLEKSLEFRFVCVNLVDLQLCSDPGNFLAAILLSLNVMLHLELSHVNVLTKCDLLGRYQDLAMPFDYFLEAQDLSQYFLGDRLSGRLDAKFNRLTENLCELVEDFSLVSFVPVAVEDGKSMHHLMKVLDKCLGYTAAAASAASGHGDPMDQRQALMESLDASLAAEGIKPDWYEHFIKFGALRESQQGGGGEQGVGQGGASGTE
ncbi:GPN-loop GTPase [Chloropicon primus]|uniref:GPN-loop GTPase 2 n=1 Tax=Chloropicon primus TaxID=1764295 RepID=A0A5B8MQV1_9CHLO|nr:GPN-loop GTPase [Chloropicon primus]UPR02080.1 GPN-loop GTPase [Chloropicon primus]|eukprot:QDZ22856.1 GPN-loop GTPase [Chloropicon primus]